MIPIDALTALAAELDTFRGDGRSNIIFDSRDRGNYSVYSWGATVAMLSKADPTGLSIGMLIYEMVEATIAGSQVPLQRVLRDSDFLASLSKILNIRERLLGLMGEPRDRLLERTNQALAATATSLGEATTREVAICLRDAIYSIDKGLKLHWLECASSSTMARHVPLSNTIHQFATLAAFSDALRAELPCGAYLVRIGVDHTAIGLKQPGKIALLSSMGVDVHSGGMQENRASGYHMAESLDLATAVERYPNWTPMTSIRNAGAAVTVSGRDTHELNHLAKLPRDRLIWVAMLVDIAAQRMADTDPPSVELAESITRALPAKESHQASFSLAVLAPNWIASELTLEQALVDLELAPWELKFLAPALEHVSVETFLPHVNASQTLNVVSGQLTEFAGVPLGDHAWVERNVKITPMRSDWVGTRKELDKARKTIFERNLARYLLTWGNLRFNEEWAACKPWFKSKLEANLPGALLTSSAHDGGLEFSAYKGVHFYTQSAKHRTYNPRCYFDGKKLPTHVVRFQPDTAQALVDMLGLKSPSELPEFLQGWGRTQSWTTTDTHPGRALPVDTNHRWCFSDRREHVLEASLCLNAASLPEVARKAPALRPVLTSAAGDSSLV